MIAFAVGVPLKGSFSQLAPEPPILWKNLFFASPPVYLILWNRLGPVLSSCLVQMKTVPEAIDVVQPAEEKRVLVREKTFVEQAFSLTLRRHQQSISTAQE